MAAHRERSRLVTTSWRMDDIEHAAVDVFVDRGWLGTTMQDVADASRQSRALLYREYRDTTELLVRSADRRLLREDPLPVFAWSERGEPWTTTVARKQFAWYARNADLELALRGVAGAGSPRARQLVATIDLDRHRRLHGVLTLAAGRVGERLHLLELLVRPATYAHLVVRCGWDRGTFVRQRAAELQRLLRPVADDGYGPW